MMSIVEKRYNNILNDFLNDNYKYFPSIIDNLDIILNMCNYYLIVFDNLFSLQSANINMNSFSKTSFIEEIELIKKFYKDNNIDFNIEKIISNGELDLNNFDVNNTDYHSSTEILEFLTFGNVRDINDDIKSILIPNNGVITDSIILVHELSHYKDFKSNKTSESLELFTEAIAFLEEFMYIDWLEKTNYKKDALIYKYLDMLNFYGVANYLRRFIKILMVYDKYGSISRDNYMDYYKSDYNYNYDISILDDDIIDVNNQLTEYIIAGFLLPFLLRKCKNKDYYNKIKYLHDNIYKMSIEDVLNYLELNDFKNKMSEILVNDLENMEKELADVYPLINDLFNYDLVSLNNVESSKNFLPYEIVDRIKKSIKMKKECEKRNIETSSLHLYPERIILSDNTLKYLFEESDYDLIGVNNNEYYFQWGEVNSEEYIFLTVKKDIIENNYYLSSLKYKELNYEEFIWNCDSKEGKKGEILFYRFDEPLEETTEMCL